jgi:hypothetical protein
MSRVHQGTVESIFGLAVTHFAGSVVVDVEMKELAQ